LVEHFIKKYCTAMSRDSVSIEPAALKRIEDFEFPGNVRELENMIERAIVIGNGKEIKLNDLPMVKDVVYHSAESLNELEKNHIQLILDKYNWNISRASKALRIDRVTLYNKIKKYQLKAQ
jgi:DNA-binding NtrC family response regulator